MGKFSNKEVPSFLKKANYYSEEETFDNEAGRNPEVTEDCETCGKAPAVEENKVLRFSDFLTEKKKYNKKYDTDKDGDNDFEDYKAFKTAAINKAKGKSSIKESEEPEPVFTPNPRDTKTIALGFAEGQTQLDPKISAEIKAIIKMAIAPSLPVIKKFYNNPDYADRLKQLITFHVGTSHTASFDRNSEVAAGRLAYITKLVGEVLAGAANDPKTGGFGLRADIAYKLITQSDKSYRPSTFDATFYDPKKFDPQDRERFGYIVIDPMTVMGRSKSSIDLTADQLRIAKGYNIDPDEGEIAKQICNNLETYSDIKDLDYELRDHGGLQAFINSTITAGLTAMGDDSAERIEIVNCLNAAAKTSGKGEIAKIVNDSIALILTESTQRILRFSQFINEMQEPADMEDVYQAEGGHTCHDGSKNMLSEAAHHLIESMCESTCSDASMYENDENPEHKFEGYINEACAYMEKCMYEMVDDGLTVNEAWNNESACYESTCEMIKEVCEKLCHEGLEIHNDESVNEFNDYVTEAIGCYKNGLMEYAKGGYGMNESERSPSELAAIVSTWTSQNQEMLLDMSIEQQAAAMGLTLDEYEIGAQEVGKRLKDA